MKTLPKKFVALDLETTGFSPEKDEIIEIGACVFDENGIIESFDKLVKPSVQIPQQVASITGIVDEDVSSAETFDEIRDSLRDFIGDYPIVGHNVHFDVGFLKGNGIDLSEHDVYDTWQLSTLFLREVPSHSLEALSKIFGITQDAAHRAYDDAVASMHLFLKLTSLFYEVDKKTLQDICAFLDGRDYVYSSYFNDALSYFDSSKKKHTKQKDLFSVSQKFSHSSQNVSARLSSSEEHLVHEIVNADSNKLVVALNGYDNQFSLAMGVAGTSKERFVAVVPGYQDVLKMKEYIGAWGFSAFCSGGLELIFDEQRFAVFTSRDHMSFNEIHVACKVFLWKKDTKNGFLRELAFTYEEYRYRGALASSVFDAQHSSLLSEIENEPLVILTIQDFLYLSSRSFDFSKGQLFFTHSHDLERNVVSDSSMYFSLSYFSDFFAEMSELSEQKALKEKIDFIDGKIGLFFGLVGNSAQKHPDFSWNMLELSRDPFSFFGSEINDAFAGLKDELESFVVYLRSVFETDETGLVNRFERFIKEFLQFFTVDEDDLFYRKVTVRDGSVSFYIVRYIQESHFLKAVNQSAISVIFSGLYLDTHDFSEMRSLFGDLYSYIEPSVPEKEGYDHSVTIVDGFPGDKNREYYATLYGFIKKRYESAEKGLLVVFKSRSSVSSFFEKFGYQFKKDFLPGFFWGAAGSTGRVETLLAAADKPILCISAYHVFDFDFSKYEFDTIVFEKFSFLPPKKHDKQFKDDFMTSALPRATAFFKRIFGHTHFSFDSNRDVYLLDPKAVTARYAQSFFDAIDYTSFEIEKIDKFVDK